MSTGGCPVALCIWGVLRKQAEELRAREPLLAPLVDSAILSAHATYCDALLSSLAAKLGGGALPAAWFLSVFREALALGGHRFVQATLEDLLAVEQRDPATSSIAQVLLYYKGLAVGGGPSRPGARDSGARHRSLRPRHPPGRGAGRRADD